MDLEAIAKRLKSAAAPLAAIAFLLTTLADVRTKWIDLFSNPLTWAWHQYAIVAAACLGIYFLHRWSKSAWVSKLLEPDALRLNPRSSEHLFGRAGDIDQLVKKIEEGRIIFLVGESGSGKTALLGGGIVDHPYIRARFVPLHIDLSTLDFDQGIAKSVAETYWRTLSKEQRDQLHLKRVPDHRELSRVFKQAYERLGLRTLILLDQYDDYVSNFRRELLPRETNEWLSADRLKSENASWGLLSSLLPNVHILIATRDDFADSLECVRLVTDPKYHRLFPLERGYVRQVIDRLTFRKPELTPVISEPEHGWHRLRDRLVSDLEIRGAILPQQLKVVLVGLRELRAMTVAEYHKVGGVAGLEANFVSHAIDRATRASNLHRNQVTAILRQLVDDGRQPPAKGRPRTTLELAENTGNDDSSTGSALRSLQDDEVVRQSSSGQGTEDTLWQLDHDYLAGPILRIHRDQNRWRLLLVEKRSAFDEAGRSPIVRWRALLSATEQTRLFLARLRGAHRYEEQRTFALISLIRFAPVLLAVVVPSVGIWGYLDWRNESNAQTAARQIWDKVELMDSRFTSDVDESGLWILSHSSRLVQDKVVSIMLESGDIARKFMRRPEAIMQAIVGANSSYRSKVIERLTLELSTTGSDDIALSILAALAELGAYDKLDQTKLQIALKRYRPLDDMFLVNTFHIAHAFGPILLDRNNSEAFQQIINSIRYNEDLRSADRAIGVLAAAIAKLPMLDALELLRQIEGRDSYGHSEFSDLRQKLGDHLAEILPIDKAQSIIRYAIESGESEIVVKGDAGQYYAGKSRRYIAENLLPSLPKLLRRRALSDILDALAKVSDARERRILLSICLKLGEELEPEEAQKLSVMIGTEGYPDDAWAASILMRRMDEAGSREIFSAFKRSLKDNKNNGKDIAALVLIARRLAKTELAQEIFELVVTELHSGARSSSVAELFETVAVVKSAFSNEEASALIGAILKASLKGGIQRQDDRFDSAVESIAGMFSGEQAANALHQIANALESRKFDGSIIALSQVGLEIAKRVTGNISQCIADIRRVWTARRAVSTQPGDAADDTRLIEAVVSKLAQATSEQEANTQVASLLAEVEKVEDLNWESLQGILVSAFSERLNAQDAQQVFDNVIVQKLSVDTRKVRGRLYARIAGSLARSLTAGQARTAFSRMVPMFEKSERIQNPVPRWAASIASRLSEDDALVALDVVVDRFIAGYGGLSELAGALGARVPEPIAISRFERALGRPQSEGWWKDAAPVNFCYGIVASKSPRTRQLALKRLLGLPSSVSHTRRRLVRLLGEEPELSDLVKVGNVWGAVAQIDANVSRSDRPTGSGAR